MSFSRFRLFGLALACLFLSSPATPAMWITAYYPGWQQDRMPPSEIDMGAVTHLVHFSLLPRADGSLDEEKHGLSPARSQAVTSAARRTPRWAQAPVQVLVCVGGADTAEGFRGAMQPANRARFITNLVSWVRARGYDGIDLDMEPIEDRDVALYEAFVRDLRPAMRRANPRWILTAATASQPTMFGRLAPFFEQVNVMAYDMSGTWEGWVSWHNSPLANARATFPNSTRPLPTIAGVIAPFQNADMEDSKLGMGLPFYGTAWRGVSSPRASIEGVTTFSVTYAEIADGKFAPAVRKWDSAAQVPFLWLDAPAKKDDLFISYDDEASLQLKVAWAHEQNLGGVMIWELGSGYRPEQLKGERDPLLQAVKHAVEVGR